MKKVQIGLIGDFIESKHTHIALDNAIEHCKRHLSFEVFANWIPTPTITQTLLTQNEYDGFWITPGSPYKNDSAVYDVITWCRENNFPVLGTCGGFQYMVVEYARNVLKINGAGHGESEPHAADLIISKLSCSLKDKKEEVLITDQQSWLYRVIKANKFTGHFNCNYGVNEAYLKRLNTSPISFTAFAPDGAVRAIELKQLRFFNGILFQPPLDSTREKPNALIMDFLTQLYSYQENG